MESFETQILHSSQEASCPRCGYPNWVRMSEIVVGTTILCPCCRVRIRLVNDRGSATTAARQIEATIREALKGWGQ
jgi:hypothetical protein